MTSRRVSVLVVVICGLLLGGLAGSAAATIFCDGGFCGGTDGDDDIVGTSNYDLIKAHAGNDDIEAKAFPDSVHTGDQGDDANGGSGADEIFGAEGFDTLRGDLGDDYIVLQGERYGVMGGDGDDDLHGGDGHDFCKGGPGGDSFDNCEELDL